MIRVNLHFQMKMMQQYENILFDENLLVEKELSYLGKEILTKVCSFFASFDLIARN